MPPVLFQGNMKITVSKIAAAKSQLLEAINLFFEERDPISIHTLTCVALQILHDHFDHVGQVWDADRDLKAGKTSIEFNTEENAFYILEAARCLRIVEGSNYVFHPEFRAFICWYGLKYPRHFKDEEIKRLFSGKDVNPDNYKYFRDAIIGLKGNPGLMQYERKTE